MRPLRWRLPPRFFYGAETHRDADWPAGAAHDPAALALPDYIAQFVRAGQLDEQACYRWARHVPVADRRATHGTHIMDVATGWPNPLRHLGGVGTQVQGGPHDADVVFVQLPRVVGGRQVAGLLRANVYDALRYIENCAAPGQPVVVNLSYGGYAGPHDGTTVLEEAVDSYLRYRRTTHSCFDVVIAAGNARGQRLHARERDGSSKRLSFHWNNLPDDPSDSFVELWLPTAQGVAITITTPNGKRSPVSLKAGAATLLGGAAEDTPIAALVFAEKVCQTRPRDAGHRAQQSTMALLAVNPTRLGTARGAAPYGTWTIEIEMPDGLREESEFVHAWCELDAPPLGSGGQPRQSYFGGTDTTQVDDDGTLNAIAHGRETTVVGGHAIGGPVAVYSGTGPGRGLSGRARHAVSPSRPIFALRGPQCLAPSDEHAAIPGIAAAALIGHDTVRMNGTSVAAAIHTRRILDSWRASHGPTSPVPVSPKPGHAKPGAPPPHPDTDLLP